MARSDSRPPDRGAAGPLPASRAVIAIGGNSLIRDSRHQTVQDQYEAVAETDHHIAALVARGWQVAVTHGNGPQVGFILRRSELAAHELHEIPLDVCGADTQGAIGYALQQNLQNDFRRLGIDREVVSIVTQVEVSPDDPAFLEPTKPIGRFVDEASARDLRDRGWRISEEPGKGWRRLVPSPRPVRIVEEKTIRELVERGTVVVAVGGGGIPVIRDADGNLRGVSAVIDKDLASSLLARAIGATILIISSTVEKVALGFGTSRQRWLDHMTLDEARSHLAGGGEFGRGTMEPKIRAVVEFLESGGDCGLITSPENLERAVAGATGTRITR